MANDILTVRRTTVDFEGTGLEIDGYTADEVNEKGQWINYLSGNGMASAIDLMNRTTVVSEMSKELKAMLGADFAVIDGRYRQDSGGVTKVSLWNTTYAAKYFRYHDRKGNKKASIIIDALVGTTLDIIINDKFKRPYKPGDAEKMAASRIMSEKRKFHPLFGDENVDKVTKMLGCARNSAKLAKWFWEYIYYTLTPQERADLDRVNPVINGRRKDTIHQWLEESATIAHRKHFDQILFILRVSNTEQEFRENFRRMYNGYFQENLFN